MCTYRKAGSAGINVCQSLYLSRLSPCNGTGTQYYLALASIKRMLLLLLLRLDLRPAEMRCLMVVLLPVVVQTMRIYCMHGDVFVCRTDTLTFSPIGRLWMATFCCLKIAGPSRCRRWEAWRTHPMLKILHSFRTMHWCTYVYHSIFVYRYLYCIILYYTYIYNVYVCVHVYTCRSHPRAKIFAKDHWSPRVEMDYYASSFSVFVLMPWDIVFIRQGDNISL